VPRHKDSDWDLPDQPNTWEQIAVAVLMDIRDELSEVRRRLSPLQCPNFLQIPYKLDTIVKNTTKRRKRRKAAK
jgi:hypothetical protein